MNFSERLFLHVLPVIGACMSFFDIALLLKKDLPGVFIVKHDWFFRCSQFAVWVRVFCVIYFFLNDVLYFLFFFSEFSSSHWLFENMQTVVILFSRCFNGCYIFCNRILCFWWIVKIILATLHLFATYPSFKVHFFKEASYYQFRCSMWFCAD